MPSLEVGVYVPPMLGETSDVVPTGDDWAYELKWDGVRAQVHVHDGRFRVFTRRGRDVTSLVPDLHGLSTLLAADSIVDGELVVFRPEGKTDFSAVMGRLTGRARLEMVAVTYVAFDVIVDRGAPLVAKSYLERRAAVARYPRQARGWYARTTSSAEAWSCSWRSRVVAWKASSRSKSTATTDPVPGETRGFS